MLKMQPSGGTESKRFQHCFLQKVWLANLQETIKNPGSVLQMNEKKTLVNKRYYPRVSSCLHRSKRSGRCYFPGTPIHAHGYPSCPLHPSSNQLSCPLLKDKISEKQCKEKKCDHLKLWKNVKLKYRKYN